MKSSRLSTVRALIAGAVMMPLAWGLAPSPGQASEGDVVRVGAVPVSGQTDIHVAKSLGFFEEEGVNVEIVKVRSGAEAQAAVVSGNLEVIGVNAISMILGLHEGFGFMAMADGFRAPTEDPGTSGILVRNDGAIKNPKDLEGKRLGIITRKGLHELYLDLWAGKHDVDLSKVTMIEVGYSQMVDALINDQVDAVIPLEPFITRGLESGKIDVLAFYDTEVDPGHANGLWVGMRKWAEANPEAATGFQNAIHRAHEYLNNNPKERLALTVEWTGLDASFVEKTGQDGFTSEMPVASMQKQADTMHELGWLENKVDVSDAFWKPQD